MTKIDHKFATLLNAFYDYTEEMIKYDNNVVSILDEIDTLLGDILCEEGYHILSTVDYVDTWEYPEPRLYNETKEDAIISTILQLTSIAELSRNPSLINCYRLLKTPTAKDIFEILKSVVEFTIRGYSRADHNIHHTRELIDRLDMNSKDASLLLVYDRYKLLDAIINAGILTQVEQKKSC